MKKLLSLLCIMAASSYAQANHMQFALSSDMVEVNYQANLGKNYNTQATWLHADDEGLKSNVLGLGLFASNQAGRWTSNLGGRAYWMDGENDSNSYGIGLGGSIGFAIAPKFSVGAGLIFSPDVINGGDFENYYDAEIRADFKVMQHATIYIALRSTEASINNFDYEIYNGGAFGFKFAM